MLRKHVLSIFIVIILHYCDHFGLCVVEDLQPYLNPWCSFCWILQRVFDCRRSSQGKGYLSPCPRGEAWQMSTLSLTKVCIVACRQIKSRALDLACATAEPALLLGPIHAPIPPHISSLFHSASPPVPGPVPPPDLGLPAKAGLSTSASTWGRLCPSHHCGSCKALFSCWVATGTGGKHLPPSMLV